MAINVKDILNQMMVYINEYDADLNDPDAFEQETAADLQAHIDAAARMVAQVAPSNLQEATNGNVNITLTKRPDNRYYGAGTLPTDYMRLIYIVSENLYRPITQLLPATHPTYNMQYCPIEGFGAGEYAPMGYQVDGAFEIHSFKAPEDGDGETESSEQETETIQMSYLTLPAVSGSGDNAQYQTLKPELTDVIAMQAAALYLGMNDSGKAAQAQQMATGMLNGIINNEE